MLTRRARTRNVSPQEDWLPLTFAIYCGRSTSGICFVSADNEPCDSLFPLCMTPHWLLTVFSCLFSLPHLLCSLTSMRLPPHAMTSRFLFGLNLYSSSTDRHMWRCGSQLDQRSGQLEMPISRYSQLAFKPPPIRLTKFSIASGRRSMWLADGRTPSCLPPGHVERIVFQVSAAMTPSKAPKIRRGLSSFQRECN